MDLKRLKFIDKPFAITLTILILFGLVVLRSATVALSFDSNSLVIKQIGVILVGLVGIVMLIRYDYLQLRRYSLAIYILANLLLILVLVFGQDIRGTKGWLSLGPIPPIQVAEISKILLILAFANYLCSKRGNMDTFLQILPGIMFMGFPFVLIMMQPDLGTALVYIVVTIVMMFFAGANPRILLTLLLIGAFSIALVLTMHFYFDMPLPMQDYQIKRLTVFLNPYEDGQGGRGAGWNTIQSLVAIGSGGLSGRGLFNGTQVQLNFLPEHHTDFIYAVIGEELGFLGAFGVIILYLIILLRTAFISLEAKEDYGSLIVIGISAMWLFHVFENIGMSIGVMPITGIPLPFLSYGGSSMLTNLIAVGLIFSVNIRGNQIVF